MPSKISERLISMQPLWGAWNVEEPIGEGSYGTVYRIRRREQAFGIEQECALKWIALPQREGDMNRLRSENMSDQDIRAYYEGLIGTLKNEILLMSGLSGNSHIVNYMDHSIVERRREIGWDILIRMELLTPLDKHIEHAPFSERDVVRMGADICDALALCEQRKILHRDVKPDNIFISKDGLFKLGDFGVSRTLEKTVSHLSVKGAPLYMAPEIYRYGDVDFSADIYSLGLVMYRLLNRNRMPFLPLMETPTHRDRESALTRRLQGDALPAPEYGCRDLKRIVLKACAFRREQRFSSAREMGEALEGLIKRDRLSPQNLMGDIGRGNRLDSGRSPLEPSLPPVPPNAEPAEGGAGGGPSRPEGQTGPGTGTIGLAFGGQGNAPREESNDGDTVGLDFEPGGGREFKPRKPSDDGETAPLGGGRNGGYAKPGLKSRTKPDRGRGAAFWLMGVAAALIVLAVGLYVVGGPDGLRRAVFGPGSISAVASPDLLGTWSVQSGPMRAVMTLERGGRLNLRSFSSDGSADYNFDRSGSFEWKDRKLYLSIGSSTAEALYSEDQQLLTISLDGGTLVFHRA